MKYDIIMPIALKEVFFVHRTIEHIRRNLKDAEIIYIITNHRYFRILEQKLVLQTNKNIVLLDEDRLLDGLTFLNVKNICSKYGAERITGWFFQQFLKLGFSKTHYAKDYYLSWDADTIPLVHIPFEEDGKLIFDCKKEYHKPYFVLIKNVLGLDKVIKDSFIAEHMLFEKGIVNEMLDDMEKQTTLLGESWWEKVLNNCDYSVSLNCFSEFETYGTYAYSKNPSRYKFRQLSTFRRGGFVNGRFISDKMLEKLSFDLDTVSFEFRDTPCFPLSIRTYLYRLWIKILSKYFL